MVVAIIALLIGILLPSLDASRVVARGVACSANLRSIAQLHAAYSGSNDDWIAGGPATSGWDAMMGMRGELEGRLISGRTVVKRSLNADPMFNGVAVQAWDWMGPLARMAGLTGPGQSVYPEDGETHDEIRASRFDWYRREIEMFSCPANAAAAVPWPSSRSRIGGPKVWTAGPMLPFAMSTQFTSTTAQEPFGTGVRANERGYFQPRLSNVGPASMKGLIFEGHRFTWEQKGPDFDHKIDAAYGGAFQDTGPWYIESKAMDRSAAPGEIADGFRRSRDNRYLAFRHGPRDGAEPMGNVAFFDGHVSMMTDLEATDPAMWFPSGTRFVEPAEFWRGTREAFGDLLDGTGVSP